MLFKYPANPEPALLNAAKERANVAMKRLAAGENFSAIASELTENPVGKLTAGDIGFVQTGDQPWMVEALKDLKVGEHTGLIESPEGIQILELTDNRPAIIAPYANVRDKVIKDIQDEAQRKVRNEYVFETLGKGVKIEVVEESLKPLFPNGVLP
jgi:parvulin-like peptidyl-prolyl isomerase